VLGTFTHSNGTVFFNGSTNQDFNSSGRIYYRIVHGSTNSLSLITNNLTVTNGLTNLEGTFKLNNRNLTMTGAARALYGVQVTDLMTCYKMYRSSLIKGMHIKANGVDFEAEFTARLAQRGARFAEVPVRFSGRTFEEGKKIRAFDAVRVMRELIRCKVTGEARG